MAYVSTAKWNHEQRPFKVKTCYTAIFSNYDDLKQPAHPSMVKGWKMICFTDQDLDLPEGNLWEIRKVPLRENDPIKTARYYKIMFHKHIETEFSLWIDATFIVNINLNRWWKRFKKPFTTIKHPFDDCIYTDINSCISGGKGDKWMLERQKEYYLALGVRKRSGLISSGILMRQKEPNTVQFCKTWWHQVSEWSSRDQPAFGYAQFKHPGSHTSIEWDYTTQKEFVHIPHLHKWFREEKLKAYHEINSGKK